MNRGKYDFPNENERDTWYKFIDMTIGTMLHEPANCVVSLTGIDVSPCLLDKCLTACGWCHNETIYDKECSWSYYYNEEYPYKGICVFVNVDTLTFQMDCYDKEEE